MGHDMPNWCYNTLIVKSEKAVLDDLLLAVKGTDSENPTDLSLAAIAGDEGEDNWYEWRLVNWGSKWDVEATLERQGDNQLVYTFSSAWAPPLSAIEKLSERFPKVNLVMSWIEPGMGMIGVETFREGESQGALDLSGVASELVGMLLESENGLKDVTQPETLLPREAFNLDEEPWLSQLTFKSQALVKVDEYGGVTYTYRTASQAIRKASELGLIINSWHLDPHLGDLEGICEVAQEQLLEKPLSSASKATLVSVILLCGRWSNGNHPYEQNENIDETCLWAREQALLLALDETLNLQTAMELYLKASESGTFLDAENLKDALLRQMRPHVKIQAPKQQTSDLTGRAVLEP
jgi:hypothetical protein